MPIDNVIFCGYEAVYDDDFGSYVFGRAFPHLSDPSRPTEPVEVRIAVGDPSLSAGPSAAAASQFEAFLADERRLSERFREQVERQRRAAFAESRLSDDDVTAWGVVRAEFEIAVARPLHVIECIIAEQRWTKDDDPAPTLGFADEFGEDSEHGSGFATHNGHVVTCRDYYSADMPHPGRDEPMGLKLLPDAASSEQLAAFERCFGIDPRSVVPESW